MSKQTPEKWRQGRLLDTPQTKRWTDEERKEADFHERCRIFANFIESDRGRSRVFIAACHTPDQVDKILTRIDEAEKLNAEMLEALKEMKDHLSRTRTVFENHNMRKKVSELIAKAEGGNP